MTEVMFEEEHSTISISDALKRKGTNTSSFLCQAQHTPLSHTCRDQGNNPKRLVSGNGTAGLCPGCDLRFLPAPAAQRHGR